MPVLRVDQLLVAGDGRIPAKGNVMTAKQILDLLAVRHHGDVFVPECKDGPTVTGRHLRLDAWAMKRSWSNPIVWGYEIKVSRSDFLRDDKWTEYLELCTHFSVACPGGMIEPAELPDGVGLLWVSKTGSRLYTKRKAAPRMNVEIPVTLYMYIIMCRAVIQREHANVSNAEYWKRWLEQKHGYREIGYRVSKRIQDHVHMVEDRSRKLEAENRALESVRRQLDAMGITQEGEYHTAAYYIERRIKELTDVIPDDLWESLGDARRALDRLSELMSKYARDNKQGG